MHKWQGDCRKKDVIASESPPSVVEHDSRHFEWFSQFFLLSQSTRLSSKMWWTRQLDIWWGVLPPISGSQDHQRCWFFVGSDSVSSKWILISVSSKWVVILFLPSGFWFVLLKSGFWFLFLQSGFWFLFLKSGFWFLRGGFWKSLLGFSFPCQLVSSLIFNSKPWKYVSNHNVDFTYMLAI